MRNDLVRESRQGSILSDMKLHKNIRNLQEKEKKSSAPGKRRICYILLSNSMVRLTQCEDITKYYPFHHRFARFSGGREQNELIKLKLKMVISSSVKSKHKKSK